MSTTTEPGTARPPGGGSERTIRASHAEREATVARLHQAMSEGRLDLDETERRVTAAYAAEYREDLPTLLADLPDDATSSPSTTGTRTSFTEAPGWAEMWLLMVWRARTAVWGERVSGSPTAAQLRTAGLLAGLAVVWPVLCAVLVAAMVAS